MMNVVIEIIGWMGAGFILLAYALLSFGKVQSNSVMYQSLNLAGAAGIAANALFHAAYPSAGLNVVWAAIACIALLKNRAVR